MLSQMWGVWINQWVSSGQLHMEYCHTNDMLADLFTRPFHSAKHRQMTARIFGVLDVLPAAAA